ncbi:MAG TPA: hypothetical protein VIY48_19185 [Candidatus Paceibacterota bacterium]
MNQDLADLEEPSELEEESELDKESRRRKVTARSIYLKLQSVYSTAQEFSAAPKCAGMPLKYFTISYAGDKPTDLDDEINRRNLKVGLATCTGCPLLYNDECYDKADPMDLKWTIRGGEIPERWDQERDRIHRGGRPLKAAETCKNGHDVTGPRARVPGGSCRKCAAEREAQKYRDERAAMGLKVSVRGVTCRNGHDLTIPNSRYASGRCKQCLSGANARAEARRKRARKERLAAKQTEGVES